MWHAVYEASSGRLVSSGSSVAATLPAGMAVKTFAAPPAMGMGWNPSTLAFDAPTPAAPTALSPIDFLQRFTVQERIAIRAAARTDPVVEDFMDLIYAAQSITGGHPLLGQGLGYLAQQGLVSPERAASIGAF